MQNFIADIILWAVAVISVLIAVFSLMQVNKLRKQLDQNKDEAQMLVQSLRNETQAMGSGSIGMGQRLLEVEKKLNQAMERQAELEQKDSGGLPYQYAIRLVQMGASADDLVENCGLARVEADLLERIHNERRYPRRDYDTSSID